MSNTTMFPIDSSVSTVRTMWQRIDWCTKELPSIKQALKDTTKKMHKLTVDIEQNEGETLIKWRARNPSTVLETRYWNQVQELAKEIISREKHLGSVITEIAPFIKSITETGAGPILAGTRNDTRSGSRGRKRKSSPGDESSSGSSQAYSSRSRSHSRSSLSPDSEPGIVFDRDLSRSPSPSKKRRVRITPNSKAAEPDESVLGSEKSVHKMPTTFRELSNLPAELRSLIWQFLEIPPHCLRNPGAPESSLNLDLDDDLDDDLPLESIIESFQDDSSQVNYDLWSAFPESRDAMLSIYSKLMERNQQNPEHVELNWRGECTEKRCVRPELVRDGLLEWFSIEMGKFIYQYHFYHQLVKRLEGMLDVERRDPKKKRKVMWEIQADNLPKAKVDMMYELLKGTYFYSWPKTIHQGYPSMDMEWPELS